MNIYFTKEELREINYSMNNSNNCFYLNKEIKESVREKLKKYFEVTDSPKVKKEKEFITLIGIITVKDKKYWGNGVNQYVFRVKFDEEEFKNVNGRKYDNNYAEYRVDSNIFKRIKDLPEVGDKVVVRSYADNKKITSYFPFASTSWNRYSKIIEIVKE